MTTDEDKRFKLKGQANYLEWLKRFKTMAKIEGWGYFGDEGLFTVIAGKENYALKWMMMNIADDALGSFNPDMNVSENLTKINQDHGYGFLNPERHEEHINNLIAFDVRRNPSTVFMWLDKQFDILSCCDTSPNDKFKRRTVLRGLASHIHNKSVFTQDDFWFRCRGDINMNQSWTYDEIKKYVNKYWDSHRNSSLLVDNNSFSPQEGKVDHKSYRASRNCDYCSKYPERNVIKGTHDTAKCHFGDNPGRIKLEQFTNKSSGTAYTSPTFHDSGSTPTSFFRDCPQNFVSKPGSVQTADSSSVPTTGYGSVRFGDMELNGVIHAPSFSHNLLSGIQVMLNGYKQVIFKNKLEIFTSDDKLVATGEYDAKYGLIKMNDVIKQSNSVKAKYTMMEWHSKLGHISESLIRRTLKSYGLLFVGSFEKCDICLNSKLKRLKIKKVSKTKTQVLEVIEADPKSYSIKSYDGFQKLLKLVDNASGYVYQEFLVDLKAPTLLECFRKFKERIENATSSKILNFRSDDDPSFHGCFSDYLQSVGIVKNSGQPYRKHVPPVCERAHQTITNLGKAALLGSKLPLNFYSDAELYAVYVYNRTVHYGHKISPYEKLFKKRPNITNIYPFGTICYAHIPLEIRNGDKKLSNTGVKCRFIGFGDSDGVEQRQGYKLLREDNNHVIYSVDVVFRPEIEMIPLIEKSSQDEGDSSIWSSEGNGYSTVDHDYSALDLAINEGRIVTERGSDNSEEFTDLNSNSEYEYPSHESAEESPDSLVMLCRSLNICMKDIDGSLIKSLNVAMQLGCPENYLEATKSPEASEWIDAMKTEIQSIKQAETWTLKKPDVPVKTVKNRWVFTKKCNNLGQIIRHKARLVAKGYTQRFGFDYNETFAPVVKFKSIRLLAALSAKLRLSAFQDDVPTAFLKGHLKETVWMEQPEGFESDNPDELCLLQKTLYGLKQSPREWFQVIHQYMINQGFTQSLADPCIYHNKEKNLFVGIYVDDIITVGKLEQAKEFRKNIRSHFNITEGGILEWYLGVAFYTQKDGSVILDQSVYLKQKLEEFSQYIGQEKRSSPLPSNYQKLLEDAEKEEPSTQKFPYRNIVGSLMYAMLGTRPDLAAPVSVVSQFLEKPKDIHIELVKHILKYLAGNLDRKLVYKSSGDTVLSGYVDASYANETGHKSRTGYAFLLGGSLISWNSQKQSVVAQSAAESEYYAAVSAANEALWIKQLLEDLGIKQESIILYEDNEACIALTKNPQDHKRTKHIQVKYHVIRQYVQEGLIKLVYCPTKNQLADIFTKGVSGNLLDACLTKLGFHRQGES